ncbi:MAG: AgmX/PglI C-terminal domain-containing protein [Myxococcaceae bacterium]|nr:AgmX/PglI C-terminal domain-containing protein [Myxococcaceae bacterium]
MRAALVGTLLLTGTACMHVARPAIYVKHDGAPLLPVTAVLVVSPEVKSRIDPVGEGTGVSFATGNAISQAIEQACLATFREVKGVDTFDAVPADAQVVLDLRGTALVTSLDDDALKGFDLLIDAALTLNGNAPIPLAFKKHIERPGTSDELEKIADDELGGYVEVAGTKLAARLRQVVKLPLPAKRQLGQLDVTNVVKANIYGVKSCVDEQHRLEPGKTGKLVMQWRVLTTGDTTEVQVVSKEHEGSPLAQCIATEIMAWRFPPSLDAMPEPVRFPFQY